MLKFREPQIFPITAAIASSIVVALWGGYFFLQWHFGAGIWPSILPGFADTEIGAMGPMRAPIPIIIERCLWFVTFAAAGLVWLTYRRARFTPGVRERLFSLAASFGVTWILLEGMMTRSYEGTWYNIQTMMTHPSTVPVFGQRLLMIWPAMLIKHLSPGLPYLHAFLAAQALGLVVAVIVTGEWAALFIGRRLKFLGQILLAAFLLPTFTYYTAHDVGVVITYTLCFLFLYKRRYWAFGLAFCIGILNHPNILLLVPAAAVALWQREKRSPMLWLVALSLAAYVSIRLLLNLLIPLPYSVEQRLWWNMRAFAELSRLLVLGQLTLLPWYVCALAALRKADPFLRASFVLLPMQYLVFAYYGQLYEARLFDGFIPVLIGIFLCWVRDYVPSDIAPTKPEAPVHSDR